MADQRSLVELKTYSGFSILRKVTKIKKVEKTKRINPAPLRCINPARARNFRLLEKLIKFLEGNGMNLIYFYHAQKFRLVDKK